MQQAFELPELDRKKTQAAVEEMLSKYRVYKFLDFEEKEATVTAGYQERFHGPTNVTSDQTASVAIYNVDVPAARRAHCEKIEKAVRRLHPKERLLIEERYMKDDYQGQYIKDYQVYSFVFNPPITAKTYDKIRWKAFYKLALALNVAVEKNE